MTLLEKIREYINKPTVNIYKGEGTFPTDAEFYTYTFLPFRDEIRNSKLYKKLPGSNDKEKDAYIFMNMKHEALLFPSWDGEDNLLRRIKDPDNVYGNPTTEKNGLINPHYEALYPKSDYVEDIFNRLERRFGTGNSSPGNMTTDDSSESSLQFGQISSSPLSSQPSQSSQSSGRTNNINQRIMSTPPTIPDLSTTLTPVFQRGQVTYAPRGAPTPNQPSQLTLYQGSPSQSTSESGAPSEVFAPAPQQKEYQLNFGLKPTASNPRADNENSVESYSNEQVLGRVSRDKLIGSYNNDAARAKINTGFNISDLKNVFNNLYYKGTSILPSVDIGAVKYNYTFGIPSKELSEAMTSYYEWIEKSITALSKPSHFIFKGEGTTKYQTMRMAYDKILELTKAALLIDLKILKSCKWNGENIGSNKKCIVLKAALANLKTNTKEFILAKAFLFPFVRAIAHFHNCLGKALEEYYGPDIRKAVGTTIHAGFTNRTIKSTEENILSEADYNAIDDGKAKAAAKRGEKKVDYADLPIVGIMFSEGLIQQLLKEKLFDKNGSPVTIRGAIGILNSCKNPLSALYNSITMFQGINKNDNVATMFDSAKFVLFPKSQKIPREWKLRWKSPTSPYTKACYIARHVFCGEGWDLMPSEFFQMVVKHAILVKKGKSDTFKLGNIDITINDSNKDTLFATNQNVRGLTPLYELNLALEE